MTEHPGAITMRGNPLTLVGSLPEVGQTAPEFEVLDNNLTPVKLSDYKGKICIIASVPSLDTPVCDIETRRFNTEAAKLSADVVILTISMDLPFAQKRWCGAAGIEKVITLSDHRYAEFGAAFGIIIKELRLLARAVFVVDKNGIIRMVQLVKEVAQEPDYAAVLDSVKKLT
jgi:thioredoxin-dependent peroxiredoxin